MADQLRAGGREHRHHDRHRLSPAGAPAGGRRGGRGRGAAGPVAFTLEPVGSYRRFGHDCAGSARRGEHRHGPGGRQPDAHRHAQPERHSEQGAAGPYRLGESSVGFHLQSNPKHLRAIEQLAAADRAEILVNQDSYVSEDQHSKVAVLVGPAGIEGTYTKTRLVPFGEYIPFRSALSWLTSISKAASVNMVPGPGAHPLQVTEPGGRTLTIGPLICFESAFPDMSRVDTDRGAQVIVYQTADTTFQGTWALAQHTSLGALRAAETGRPVVQAALTGDSAAFDAQGRVLAWMSSSQHGVIPVRLDPSR